MIRESRFNSGSLALNYAVTEGEHDATPILCLHGVTRCWQSFLPLVPTLALRRRVFALDHRGHGKSERAQSYFVVDYVPDVVALLREEIKQPVMLYGHSLGAMVAAAVAAEAPDLVRAVILEDPPFETMGARIEGYPLYPYFVAIQALAGPEFSISELVEKLGAIEVNTAYGKTPLREIRDASALRFTAKCLQQLDAPVLTPIARAEWLKGYDLRAIASRIEVPTLLMQADAAAGGMLTDDDAEFLASAIPDLTLVKVAGVGHQIHTAATETALRIVLGFLDSLPN